ncbi:MAG: hypothetical protein PF569_07375 [Candidatus Woesearchaeota archaeon]|jgi:TfoX/Sxy family transcriptional regulator of competence genes|nr:hypothetical protein [Candidatus Woesearchaeota archaeon]
MKETLVQIANKFDKISLCKVFGVDGLRFDYGKILVISYKNSLMIKLDENSKKEALKLTGAKIGHHIYDSNKIMKNWVLIPIEHKEEYSYFIRKAINNIKKLEK